jgi:hypothetical protein
MKIVMYNNGDIVRLRKLSAAPDTLVPTPLKEEVLEGGLNIGMSLPVDYELEGRLDAPLEIGKPISLLRHKRNGVRIFGITTTSYVKAMYLDQGLIETENSIYIIDRVDD